ncbi:hypothetical protein Tco_1330402 [Tanacetum coccineum]
MTKYSIHLGADTMLCGFRLTNRWLSIKNDIASCGSKYLAYSEVEVEYQGSSGLLLQPELPDMVWKGMYVTVLWAVTGKSELNGSNLVQETTNKIMVIQERLEEWETFELMLVGYEWLKVSPWKGVVRLERKTS